MNLLPSNIVNITPAKRFVDQFDFYPLTKQKVLKELNILIASAERKAVTNYKIADNTAKIITVSKECLEEYYEGAM